MSLESANRRPLARGPLHRLCLWLARVCLTLAVLGLLGVIAAVSWQVIGRYVFNDTPTWAEALALQLVLFVTAFGLAVGVRDAGHIGLESLVALASVRWQRWLGLLVHALVACFGLLMAKAGWVWTTLNWSEPKPMLGVPMGLDYLALVISGLLVALFSVEQFIAAWRNQDLEPTWN